MLGDRGETSTIDDLLILSVCPAGDVYTAAFSHTELGNEQSQRLFSLRSELFPRIATPDKL